MMNVLQPFRGHRIGKHLRQLGVELRMETFIYKWTRRTNYPVGNCCSNEGIAPGFDLLFQPGHGIGDDMQLTGGTKLQVGTGPLAKMRR